MHILYISDSTIPSRTANSIQVLKMCQAFSQCHHIIELISPYSSSNIPFISSAVWDQYGIINRIPIKFFRRLPFLRYYDFLVRAVISARFSSVDIIYTRNTLAVFFASLLGIPTILELHSPPSGALAPFLFKAYLRSKVRRRVITISQA